jgi:DNA (cytosine-5)-methyltransferase 1
MQGRMEQVKTTISDLYSSVQIIHMNAEDCGLAQRRRRIFLVAGPAPIRQPLASTVKISMGEALGISIDRPGPGPIYPKGLGRAATEPQWLGRPSPTVMTTEVKGTRANARSCWTFNGGPDRVSDALFLALGRRRASIEECMILQGFPQDMVMCGTVEDKYRLLGNAVPPPMARMIGEEILKVHMGL